MLSSLCQLVATSAWSFRIFQQRIRTVLKITASTSFPDQKLTRELTVEQTQNPVLSSGKLSLCVKRVTMLTNFLFKLFKIIITALGIFAYGLGK
jgi:hypothetical protein